MNPATRLSALIVNYNSGAFCVRAAQSLALDWERDGRDPSRLEIVVVDNASPEDQSEHLAQLESQGVRVVRSEQNGGYAVGINRALQETAGGPEDVVAILNPDLYFLPGSVGTLVDFISAHPGCGAVDPRATIDHLGVLNLPRNPLPTLLDHARVALAHMSPRLCRAYSRRRLAGALPWWTADGPIETDMLSGCCLFLRRETVQRLGILMDERYPLYYEDTDLFRRIRSLGLTLVHHAGARVLHHWSRSTGVGLQFEGEPMRRYHISQKRYLRRFYGRLGVAFAEMVTRLETAWPRALAHRAMHPITALGETTDPIELVLPRHARFVLELGMAPTWLLAVGIVGEGDRWVCPAPAWDWFFQADYYMRAVDRDTGEFLGAWSFTKPIPGRMHPLDAAEVEAESADQSATRTVVP